MQQQAAGTFRLPQRREGEVRREHMVVHAPALGSHAPAHRAKRGAQRGTFGVQSDRAMAWTWRENRKAPNGESFPVEGERKRMGGHSKHVSGGAESGTRGLEGSPLGQAPVRGARMISCFARRPREHPLEAVLPGFGGVQTGLICICDGPDLF